MMHRLPHDDDIKVTGSYSSYDSERDARKQAEEAWRSENKKNFQLVEAKLRHGGWPMIQVRFRNMPCILEFGHDLNSLALSFPLFAYSRPAWMEMRRQCSTF
jgi:hypothetical protein